jgi:hypothetical protein
MTQSGRRLSPCTVSRRDRGARLGETRGTAFRHLGEPTQLRLERISVSYKARTMEFLSPKGLRPPARRWSKTYVGWRTKRAQPQWGCGLSAERPSVAATRQRWAGGPISFGETVTMLLPGPFRSCKNLRCAPSVVFNISPLDDSKWSVTKLTFVREFRTNRVETTGMGRLKQAFSPEFPIENGRNARFASHRKGLSRIWHAWR